MTFSDEKVIEFVNQNFIAAWETVAPVSIATFDLGNGKTLTGAYGGNIALYLCDPQGRVLDILPALQTPSTTLRWLAQSKDLARVARTITADSLAFAMNDWHKRHAETPDLKPDRATDSLTMLPLKSGVKYSLPKAAKQPEPKPEPEPLTRMAGKSMAVPRSEPLEKMAKKSDDSSKPVAEGGRILVVVAGGLTKYQKQIDLFLAEGALRTPEECKKHVFETILGEKLEGRKDVFVTDEPTSIAIPDED